MVLFINSSNAANSPLNNSLVGTNLSSINYYSSQLPFLNEFASSKSWITQNQQSWNTREENLIDIDANGWVKSLPNSEDGTLYNKVSSLFFRDHSSYMPGKYIVSYEGEGNIEYKFDAKKNEALSTPGRDVIEVNPSKSGILLSITETDPDRTGDYIRNIKVVHESQEAIADTEIFNPAFIEKIQPFSTLRFMDWMDTNNSKQKEWADRPKQEDARYSNVGAPVEIMVELANQTDTNPWFTIPHQATDEYVTNFAQYVKNNLESDLKVYVEYSNEVWNWKFDQTKWVNERAKQEWPESNLNHHDWYSKRATEVVQIWDDVFARDSERVIGVMGAQAANSWLGKRTLDYRWSDVPLTHADTGIDAIAIAPYFAGYIGSRDNTSTLESWTQEPDGGLNKLFQEINQGGLLANSPEGGALNQAYREISKYVEIAEENGLELLAYEGGQHLVGKQGVENNKAVTDLFIAANRDPRMGQAYREYLQQWHNLGGDLFVNFNDIATPSKWGSWGTLESVYEESSPKYNAIVDYIEGANSVSPNRVIGEVGRVDSINHQTQTIELANSYSNPVVFALPLSGNGADEAIARITDIQSDRFTAFVQEAEYKDGRHTNESFSYVVLEAGSWRLDDGSLVEVGSVDFNQADLVSWQNIGFQNSFDNTPAVFSQVQSDNDEQFVRTRQNNSRANGFSLKMEGEEALNIAGHGTETVGWLAIEQGQGSWGDLSYQAGRTDDEVTHRWHNVSFDEEFSASPNLLASLSSYDGSDPAGLRYRNLNSDRVEIMIEEDRSQNSEINHTTETVDFLAISEVGNLVASVYDSNAFG